MHYPSVPFVANSCLCLLWLTSCLCLLWLTSCLCLLWLTSCLCLLWLKTSGLPESEEAAKLSQPQNRNLIFVVAQQPALLQVLAAHAVAPPRHRIQTLLRQHFTAVNTFAVTRNLNPFQRFVDQIQQLPIVVRHRDQQFFGISISRHVCRILRRFCIALAAIKLRSLHLTHEALAAVQ